MGDCGGGNQGVIFWKVFGKGENFTTSENRGLENENWSTKSEIRIFCNNS